MAFGNALGTACVTFAITNIDDLFVLVTFFTEASTSRTLTPLKITVGQYVGFTIIVLVSMIGFALSLALPSEPIGFLGLLPILLGVWKALKVAIPIPEPDEPSLEEDGPASRRAGCAGWFRSIFKVGSVTIMNGGDNISTYIPLFSQAKKAEIAVYVVTYYILLGVWCLAAFLVLRQKHILRVFQKYAMYAIPLLYLGLGIYIIVKSDCYPWSIKHINNAVLSNPGQGSLAGATAGLLLTCIGCMVWYRLRKKRSVDAVSNNDEEGDQSATEPGRMSSELQPQMKNDGRPISVRAEQTRNTIEVLDEGCKTKRIAASHEASDETKAPHDQVKAVE